MLNINCHENNVVTRVYVIGRKSKNTFPIYRLVAAIVE